jgi:hypothetical protein
MNLNTISFPLVGKANKRNIACDIYAMGNWVSQILWTDTQFLWSKNQCCSFYRYTEIGDETKNYRVKLGPQRQGDFNNNSIAWLWMTMWGLVKIKIGNHNEELLLLLITIFELERFGTAAITNCVGVQNVRFLVTSKNVRPTSNIVRLQNS